jgi:hypothetical protein
MEWKWSLGEPYERSARKRILNKNVEREDEDPFINHNIRDNTNKENEELAAYSSSLFHDENTWDILNQSIYQENFRQSNRREDLDDKIANRELVQQIGFNPFLNQTNYAEDVSIHDQYMKPQNSSKEILHRDNESSN